LRDPAEPERKSVPKAEQDEEGQERGHESSRGVFSGLKENDVNVRRDAVRERTDGDDHEPGPDAEKCLIVLALKSDAMDCCGRHQQNDGQSDRAQTTRMRFAERQLGKDFVKVTMN
jgi:hypothetical protein